MISHRSRDRYLLLSYVVYTAVIADSLARWNRIKGRKTLFMTGTDEHGLKIQQAAEKKGMTPDAFCTQISNEFKNLFDKANISYDDYIRTTQQRHINAVNSMWNKLIDSGYIYKGKYEGWYSVPDESFLSEDQVQDVKEADGSMKKVSKESGHKVDWVAEENYKFKLSDFRIRLLEWLNSNPDVIQPPTRFQDIKRTLETNVLPDLSVSRLASKIKWAIPVPNDQNHTIYVWLDALTNYLTVTGYPAETYKRTWPADYHVIGKDIVKFHAIYWPAFLMAAGCELPKKLITHGYWTVNKVKMSKSIGNVVDPHGVIDKFGLDPVRYFLLSEGGFSDDGDFSEERLLARLKGDLADNFGNLVGRCTSPALNPSNTVPTPGPFTADDQQLIDMLHKLPSQVDQYYQNSEFTKATQTILTVIVATNGFFSKNEPWKLKPKKGANPDPTSMQRLGTIMYLIRLMDSLQNRYIALESMRIVTLLLQPIMPQTSSAILDRLGVGLDHRSFKHIQFGRTPNEPLKADPTFKAFTVPV